MRAEIKAACERMTHGRDYLLSHPPCYKPHREILEAAGYVVQCRKMWGDVKALSNEYYHELTLRDAEQAERALPITGEWLLDVGFRKLHRDRGYDYVWLKGRMQASGTWAWWISGDYLGEIYQQRGEVLDLLSALKIKTKGPNE